MSPRIPGPDETLQSLNWLHSEVYRAIEHGILKAKEYFETEVIKKEQSVFSAIVRLHAREYLRTRGLEAVEIEEVTLCGLSLRVPDYLLKIWKAEDENLPVPGHSIPKQEFYQQLLFTNGEKPKELCLAILWNLDSLSNLSALWLVCPKYGDAKSADAHWCIKIPDPATGISGTVSPVATPPPLPIPSKSKAKTGTDSNV